MNRGSSESLMAVRLNDTASMRPRFMNRGSTIIHKSFEDEAIASMRPRFMNRGSLFDHRILPTVTAGFNEAPIHESGKYQRYCYPVW